MNLFGIESRTTIETAPFMKTNDHDALHYCLDSYKYVTCAEVR